ncbi:hypothetical protein SARC_12411 [Sphaeroforma arctica JP610]|uniref:Gustatory receptor n=1 Tax=Sphaeroforma arctica JP610 TaxID=667725 RepID=A0A0L0FE67_9EUKA|nr:hypothetical protein SARC_12411 [Sphaeroforma arctica JP610]KNC75057.1 hypothetical protein SARC_12411 [Sphaeroforma arctica JP610]|eukprot:XP_014148959.1 hypothetical protein SARC_12411 [Sphaeroforma arctica JP610]
MTLSNSQTISKQLSHYETQFQVSDRPCTRVLYHNIAARALLRSQERDTVEIAEQNVEEAGALTMALVECAELVVSPVAFSMSLLGWQPFAFVPQSLQNFLSGVYILLIVSLFCYNYTYNFMGCIYNTKCTGLVSKYIFPPALHLASYVLGVYYFRSKNGIDTSRGLIEAVFLQSTRSRDNTTEYGDLSQMHLARVLRQNLWFGLLWMCLRCGASSLTFLYSHEVRLIPHGDPSLNDAFSLAKIFASLACDAVYGLTVTVYAIHCKLIGFYVDGWRHRIGLRKFSLAAMKKGIRTQNTSVYHIPAPQEAIQIQRVVDTLNAVHEDAPIAMRTSIVAELGTWVAILVYTLYEASTVTGKCCSMAMQGIVVRNEGYMNAPMEELDSFLMFLNNLIMKATVFGVGVRSSNLGLLLLLSSFVILIGNRTDMIELIGETFK